MSLEEEMPILAQALKRWGLIDDPAAMDVSVLSEDGNTATMWPAGNSLPIDQLPEAHKTIHANVAKAANTRMVFGFSSETVKAVSKLPHGLQNFAQPSAAFYSSIVCCNSPSAAASQIREKHHVNAVMLSEEGKAYVIADSLGALFVLAFYLNKSCYLQVLLGDRPTVEPDAKVWVRAHEQVCFDEAFAPGGQEWPAIKARILQIQADAAIMPTEKLTSSSVSPEEKSLRIALAKTHREFNTNGMDELVWNHCSAKLGDGFLVTPGDRLWDNIEPDDLLLNSKNCTANILHGAVYKSTPTKAIIHSHAPFLEAVCCLQDGFLAPPGSEFAGRVCYHGWQGLSDDENECHQILQNIQGVPDCIALIARNHGVFTWGSSVEEATRRHKDFEAACREQMKLGATKRARLQ